jgi:hypothetical protein
MDEPDSYRTTQSDSGGRFVFEDLPVGKYHVRLEMPASASGQRNWRAWRSRDTRFLSVAEGDSQHVMLGEPNVTTVVVYGQVTVGGETRAGLTVRCSKDHPNLWADCDEHGNYALKLDARKRYWFEVGEREGKRVSYLHTLGSEPRQQLDFDLPPGSIAGILRGLKGEPVGHASVRLKGIDESGTIYWADNGTSAEEGTFRFCFVEPGRYWLVAGGPGQLAKETRFAATVSEEVTLANGQHFKDLAMTLPVGGAISGYLSGPGDGSIQGVWLRIEDHLGREIIVTGVRCESPVERRYTLHGVPAGTVTVQVSAEPLGRLSEPVTVTVTAGETTPLDLALPD